MEDSLPGESDTPDDILDEEYTKSGANTDLSISDDENRKDSFGEVINQDKQQGGSNAQLMTQKTSDDDGESHILSDEGKVMEGAVGGAKVSCDQCETETAITYCQNCPGHLCKTCYDAHKKSKLTRNHSYINVSADILNAGIFVHHVNLERQESEKDESCRIVCKKHPVKSAYSVCKTCICPICADCTSEHEEHDLVTLEQKSIRQLQSTCMDDYLLVLKVVTNLEALEEIESSENMYAKAIEDMVLTKTKFEYLTGSGGLHRLVVDSLDKEKREVVEKHKNKLDTISKTLDDAKFVMSKLHFAGTTSNINIVLEALNNFYVHYNTLASKHADLLTLQDNRPDTTQLKNIESNIISLEYAFKCYKNPCSRYDNLATRNVQNFGGVIDIAATSETNFIVSSEKCLVSYFDINKKEWGGEQTKLKEDVICLVPLCDTLNVALTSDLYLVLDEKLEQVSSSNKMRNYKAISAWDRDNILILTCTNKSYVFLLNISTSRHKSSKLFETKLSFFGDDSKDNYYMSCNSCKEIFIIEEHSSRFYKFNKTGELLSSSDVPTYLPTYLKTRVNSIHVDRNDNLIVGCANGEVYFTDYKAQKQKVLLSLWGPVRRIGEVGDNLYIFVWNSCQGQGQTESTLYIYDIEPSGKSG